MLRIDAPVGGAQRIAPDLPGGLRAAQAFEEPGFLPRPQHGLRGFAGAIVGHTLVAEGQLRRRMAVGVVPAGVELHRQFLGNPAQRVAFEQRVDFVVRTGVARAETVLVGDDQVDVPAPAQGAIGDQAVDRGEVVGFAAQAVVIEIGHRRIDHMRRIEGFQAAARCRHARRLVFEPCLVRRDLERLRGHEALRARKFLDRLPALPREFVVVPHRDEGPACARILQVGILQIGVVERAVVLQRGGHVEAVVGDRLALRKVHRERDAAIVAMAVLDLVRVLHDLVDEVAQMQHEAEPVLRRGAFVFADHPPIGIQRALADVLATDEGEARRSRIVGCGRRQRAADPAAVAVLVREAIPVFACRLQFGDQHAAGPVGLGQYPHRRRRDHARERRIVRHFDQQGSARAPVRIRASRPQQDALLIGIARRDTLRIQIATLPPAARRRANRHAANGEGRAQRGGQFQERAAVHGWHVAPL